MSEASKDHIESQCIIVPIPGIGERRIYRDVAQPFSAHSHDHYVIGLVEKGCRALICNGQNVELAQGDLFVFNPGDVHSCVQGDDSLFAFDSITIDGDMLDGALLDGPKAQDPSIIHAFTDAMRALDDEDREEFDERLYCLCEMLVKTTDQDVEVRAHFDSAQHVLDHFRDHIGEATNLNELSAKEGITPFALIRAYKNRYSITPMRHLTSLRVERAAHLLKEGMKPASVATQLGFADQAHLTRCFKQRMGVTPAAYQKMLKTAHASSADLASGLTP